MQLPYRDYQSHQSVDVVRLRPGDSYANLMKKRTYGVDHLIKAHGRVPPEMLSERPCPTCGSRLYRHEMTKDYLDIVRCDDCNLVYVNPIFNNLYYSEIYKTEDYREIVRDLGQASHEYRRDRFGKERVNAMAEFLTSDVPRYLDVGCSTGFVVEAARDAGWHATGVDLNSEAIAFGQARSLDLINSPLEDAGLAAASFDAISLFDVIEHVPEPLSILRAALNLLKPDGILYVYVPNYDSASRILQGKDAHFIWPTHHLNYYTPATISDLFRREGLSIERIVTEGLDVQDYIWFREQVKGEDCSSLRAIVEPLQFFINAGAYGKNLRILGRKLA